MTNRFEQSTPPSIHDVYRGLPIGPGGVEPFVYRDCGPRRRRAVRLPWPAFVEIGGRLYRWLEERFAMLRPPSTFVSSRTVWTTTPR